MPRIGFVTTSFPRFPGDPAGNFVFGMARAFYRAGIDIDVIVPEPPNIADWSVGASWLQGIRVLKVPYIYPKSAGRLFFGAGVPDNLRTAPWTGALIPPALVQLTRTTAAAMNRWDAAVSHWLVPSALVVSAAAQIKRRAKPLPHLAIAHSGDVHLLSRAGLRPLARAIPHCATTVGFISKQLRNEFFNLTGLVYAERFRKKTCITPMGIDLPARKPARSRQLLREKWGIDRFAALFLGRMVSIKGLDVLIEALSNRPEFELIAAGDGPIRAAWSALADRRGVPSHFVGTVDETARAELFKACDVLVLPSVTLEDGRHEGLPTVLLEAMAAGLPVIAADTGAVSELVVPEKTGLLFRESNTDDLERCLARIREDVALLHRLRNQAAAEVQNRDWNRIVVDLVSRLNL